MQNEKLQNTKTHNAKAQNTEPEASPEPRLEHLNLTVGDPEKTALMLSQIFGWKTRWQGDAIHGGHVIHVGGNDTYLAVYRKPSGAVPIQGPGNSYDNVNGLNHVGVVVEDLDATEQLVVRAGLEPYSHADYDPGRRFYFDDQDGIEFEVVSYS